jgi:aminoglycoside 3-N-acetyltransferase
MLTHNKGVDRMAVHYSDINQAIQTAKLGQSVIALHSSLKSFGCLEGGPDTLIDAFLAAGCTLVVPSFNYECEVRQEVRQIEQNGWDGNDDGEHEPAMDYDPDGALITSDMGAIPGRIVNRPGRKRGRHPINPFTAIGPLASEVIERQDFLNVYGPYKWMYEYPKAYLVLAGVDLTKATPVHFGEERAGRRLFRRWGKYKGEVVECEVGGCSDGFNNLLPYVQSLERQMMVGQSLWRIYPFRAFVDTVAEAIVSKSSVTHCPDLGCARCNDAVRGGPIFNG